MRFTLLSVIGFTSVALAAPANLVSRETPVETTDRLLFSSTMAQFQKAAAARDPNTLDWTNDGCSSSPDNPLGFNFNKSCTRHDFGYRNYKAQTRFSEANKQRIDIKFKEDMYQQCRSEWWRDLCERFADTYYAAVHVFGDKKRELEVREMEAQFSREVESLKNKGLDVRARNLDAVEVEE